MCPDIEGLVAVLLLLSFLPGGGGGELLPSSSSFFDDIFRLPRAPTTLARPIREFGSSILLNVDSSIDERTIYYISSSGCYRPPFQGVDDKMSSAYTSCCSGAGLIGSRVPRCGLRHLRFCSLPHFVVVLPFTAIPRRRGG